MISGVTIDRETGNGKYVEVIDVAEHLGLGDYGSAANALSAMAKQSPLFVEALSRLKQAAKKGGKGKAVA